VGILRKRKENKTRQVFEGLDETGHPGGYGSHDKGKAGWVSPVYAQSTAAVLNPVTVAENKCVTLLPDAPEIEYYKLLRTRVLRRVGEGGRTIMVTSAQPGEGKTLTAINLAFTFARDYQRTALLVDCDLRKQNIHRYLGTPGDWGLIDYLLGDVGLTDLIVWPGIEKVTLISGGRRHEESTELLSSPKMAELVREMKTRYPERYVFFDFPPILSCSDAIAFAPLVDWILVVVESGKTQASDLKQALDMIPAEKILGFVINKGDRVVMKDGAGYGYRYGQGKE
jgi:protein-tyrosine kinase